MQQMPTAAIDVLSLIIVICIDTIISPTVKIAWYLYLCVYYNLDLSFCLSIPQLLCRLLTDRDQTQQVHQGHGPLLVDQGQTLKEHKNKDDHHSIRWLSVCMRESRGRNPIGKALGCIICGLGVFGRYSTFYDGALQIRTPVHCSNILEQKSHFDGPL